VVRQAVAVIGLIPFELSADDHLRVAVASEVGSDDPPTPLARFVDSVGDRHVDDATVRPLDPELVVDL